MDPEVGLPVESLLIKCGNWYFISVVPEKVNGLTSLLLSSITPNVKLDGIRNCLFIAANHA